ncbi:DUF3472 domain-containing protein [Symbiopectobacterium purcellii]|uniref:DUF3472 domain-containing protein n=1 Tax=Symbiopectobacterium purcellii TaxID=2871826 RepID=A0ABX9ARZ2_9ENTR|nr:DUF3472 domain-containing protein [Symbiopectobacterium purcellii]QZN97767.1 DUF3472 domain-containing protein [Symbiopectobacterium purcellii]
MQYSIRKMSLAPILFLISQSSYAVLAGGIVAVEHTWPTNSEFNKLSFFQKISTDGGRNSNYYWANQFYFKRGDSGYIGLQNRGKGTHAFNDSIWNAKGWKTGNCGYFNHEGSGVQCQIIVPWKTGHQYKLDVSKKGSLVTGVITDMMDGTAITVGVIEVPETFGKLYSSSGFVEEYSQGDDQLSSCYVMGTQSSTFLNPIGDDTTTARQSTTTYGNCNDPYVVQAACNDQACINNVSDLGAIASPDAPTVAIVNNNDLTAKSISNELSKANLVVIHSKDGAWAPNVYFPSPITFKWKSIFVNHNATNSSYFQINGTAKKIDKGGLNMYISDGNRWNIINQR